MRLENKKVEWREVGGIPAAASLVEAAAVVGDVSQDSMDAAEYLVKRETTATPSIKALAQSLREHLPPPPLLDLSPIELIRMHKRRISSDPRDALMWVDMARLYSSSGQNRQALRSIDVALALAPNNRFVLRSAVRLFVHCEDPERAHETIFRAERTKFDPWLVASEVATASLIGKGSRLIKTANRLLQAGDFSARDLSELAGAVATVEVEGGHARQARRLFTQSLIDPNDNALAQANWAGRKHKVASVDAELIHKVPMSYEAATWSAFWRGDWDTSLAQSTAWAEDEPFSSGPACQGSFLAISLLDAFDVGEQIARTGLKANPSDLTLKNNLLVACVYQRNIEEAERLFAEIDWQSDTPMRFAAEGLIASRKGDIDRAATLYIRAMEAAQDKGELDQWARAAFHLFKELIYWSPSSSERVSRVADLVMQNVVSEEFKHYLNSFKSPSKHINERVINPDSTDAILYREYVETILSTMEIVLERRLKLSPLSDRR